MLDSLVRVAIIGARKTDKQDDQDVCSDAVLRKNGKREGAGGALRMTDRVNVWDMEHVRI